uniref:Motile sperm domain-containing protein 1 n=1 Tax=Steinernema glaseri TaxID=37863 RepID=A0A1I7Z5H7_9BILA
MDSSVRSNAENSGSLPIFLFPNAIHFDHSRPRDKKMLTLYNPYDFPIVYRVLSTASRRYTVLEPSGTVYPKRVIDISIRHMAAHERSCLGVVDYFKVEIHRDGDSSINGSKVIQVRLLENLDEEREAERSSFHNVPRTRVNSQSAPETSRQRQFVPDDSISSRNFLALVFMAFAIALVLTFPTYHEPHVVESIVPSVLHPSVSQKVFFSFILGIIVAVLLMRPRLG